MSELIIVREHTKEPRALPLPKERSFDYYFTRNKRDEKCLCFRLAPHERGHHIESSYFIGVDWVGDQQQAIYIEPKLNKDADQTDYIKMLFSALKHPEVAKYTNDLFEIKFDQPAIQITQQQDLLTPLLVVQFLSVVKAIVRNGLKKSYNRVDQTLQGRIKGKVLVSSTIKHNLLKNKPLRTHCSFDEFGLNGLENRLLKKALVFVQRYLPTLKNLNAAQYTQNEFNYIMPAFESVSEEVSLQDIKHQKKNAFYQEYAEGIRLATLILKRFGYNITNVKESAFVKTPPFWIDMSKLFELYILGLLKDQFGDRQVRYHYTSSGNELDFVLNCGDYQMVIDAKYKLKYSDKFDNDDIRQVSGYARLKSVYEYFKKGENEVVDCLIIYPKQESNVFTLRSTNLKESPIKQYVHFYKLGVALPLVKN